MGCLLESLQRGSRGGESDFCWHSWLELRPSARSSSVEQDGVGVPVGDLRHVFQNVLFGDDAQQPPEEGKESKNKVQG